MKKKRLISLIAAGGLGAAALAVVTASAQASAPVPCNAGSKHAGTACVLLDIESTEVNSVRVNGRCLTWSASRPAHYYGNVAVAMNSTPTVRTYNGYRCEGNTDTTEKISASWDSTAGKRTNFRRVTINWVGDPHGGCSLSSTVIHC